MNSGETVDNSEKTRRNPRIYSGFSGLWILWITLEDFGGGNRKSHVIILPDTGGGDPENNRPFVSVNDGPSILPVRNIPAEFFLPRSTALSGIVSEKQIPGIGTLCFEDSDIEGVL